MDLLISNLSLEIIILILVIITFVFSASTYFILLRRSKKTALPSLINKMVVDTSALIDGRILEVAETGFITGQLFVPKFVLNELQNIADSSDSLRRSKGRRGFDVLKKLQHNEYMNVEITESDFPDVPEVDHKLIQFAKENQAKILTVDFNLNEVAKIQKITVLNINELSNAIKPAHLPGEQIEVKVVQQGKERDQGVGYLPDGTMIVVEGGARRMGKIVKCTVARIFQTDAGRMIFVKPEGVVGSQNLHEKKYLKPNRRSFFRPRINTPRIPPFFRKNDNKQSNNNHLDNK